MDSKSQNSGQRKLNIKRGRKKRANQNEKNTTLAELAVDMEVDNTKGANSPEEPNVETDLSRPKDTMNTNNENHAKETASDAANMLGGKVDELTLNNVNTLTTGTEMFDFTTGSLMQSLRSPEIPIDIELTADFPDINEGSLCDISMNTCAAFDSNADIGNMGLFGTSNEEGQAKNVIAEDIVTVEADRVLAEDELDGSLDDQSQAAHSKVGGKEVLKEGNVCETSIGDDEHVEANNQCEETNNAAEVVAIKRRPGRPRNKKHTIIFATPEVADENVQGQCVQDDTVGVEPVKRKRGRPGRKPTTTDTAGSEQTVNVKYTRETLRAVMMELLPAEGERKFSKEAGVKIRELLKSQKSLACPKEGCGKIYKNFTGYEYHVSRCGVSVGMACDQCGQIYTSDVGLQYHQRSAHSEQAEQDAQEEPEDPRTESSRSKYSQRRRFQRQSYGCENLAEEDDEEDSSPDEGEETTGLKSKTWNNYYEILEDENNEPDTQEGDTKTTQLTNMTEISQALRERSRLKCPTPRCGRYFKLAAKYYEHIQQCVAGKSQTFRCKLCGKIYRSITGVRIHILSLHRRKRHNSEQDDDSEFSEGEEKTIKIRNPPQRRSFARGAIDYEGKTKAWQEAFLVDTVMTCWRPSLKHWQKLPSSEAENYLPVRKMSPVFRIEPVITSPQQSTEYQLPLFSSAPINSEDSLCNLTFNVGGSVWAIDWAPVPVDEEDCDQYLAIGCHNDPDKTHLLSECYKEKGVLQIWRVPKLQNKVRPTEPAEFCLGIVHDYGPLWDIRWCPSGAWDKSSTQTDELRRLGLLALACADGKVRILSVPFPCSLLKNIGGETGQSPEDLLFRATPHAELSPGSLCRKYRDECGAAWTVSWQPINGHSKIVASYADGTVVIWNLKTENRILKAPTPDGLTECIFPLSHFQAQSSITRSLAWCPSDPNYIATGGYDRVIKMWDIRRTSQPLAYFKKAWSYNITWPLHWASLLYGTEMHTRVRGTRCFDYYSSSRNDQRTSHASTCYISHNATAWDDDYSNWTNVLASVDAAGVLIMVFLGDGLIQRSARKRMPIFRALVEPLVPTDGQGISDRGVQSESSGKGYEKRDNFKIIFKDTHPSRVTKKECDLMFNETAYVSPDQTPHGALHKVRWNPNFSSYYWLATAGKSGLVRLCYVSKME